VFYILECAEGCVSGESFYEGGGVYVGCLERNMGDVFRGF